MKNLVGECPDCGSSIYDDHVTHKCSVSEDRRNGHFVDTFADGSTVSGGWSSFHEDLLFFAKEPWRE